jgi:broad specificity phosphatase PhoE
MIIYLVRHGDKEKLQGSPPLTNLGKIQANKTGQYFQKIKIDKIYASPLLRTKQTADIISSYLKINYETNELLKERFNWGDIKNQTHTEFVDMWKKSSLVRNWKPPKGLSSEKAGNNLDTFLKSIDENIYKSIIVVSHGGIIADFLRNTFDDKTLNKVFPNFSEYYENLISVCSITTLEKRNNIYNIVKIADTNHLK